MNIAVRYYTRGGNTARLAEAVAAALNVPALSLDTPLEEPVDLLFLGCSYYAFDMDPQVKAFLTANEPFIGKLVCFGTSAMMKSMHKPMKKVLEGTKIQLSDREFHCRGSFGPMHKGHPNADDLRSAAEFAHSAAKND